MPKTTRPKLILIPVHGSDWDWEDLTPRALRKARLHRDDISWEERVLKPVPGVRNYDAHIRIEVCPAPEPRIAFIDGKQVEI